MRVVVIGAGEVGVNVARTMSLDGHDVTIVAVREEASKDLEQAAAREPRAAVHWVSLGHLGKCLQVLADAGVSLI